MVTRGRGRRRKSGLRRRSSAQESVSITFCISQITHDVQVYLSRRAEADSQMVATKPNDWTYTTTYASISDNAELSNALWTPGVPSDPHHAIPIAEMSRSDRILSFAQITRSSGVSRGGTLHTLVRKCVGLFCLRFIPKTEVSATEQHAACDADIYLHSLRLHTACRIVLLRAHDARIYHSFESAPPLVVR